MGDDLNKDILVAGKNPQELLIEKVSIDSQNATNSTIIDNKYLKVKNAKIREWQVLEAKMDVDDNHK